MLKFAKNYIFSIKTFYNAIAQAYIYIRLYSIIFYITKFIFSITKPFSFLELSQQWFHSKLN